MEIKSRQELDKIILKKQTERNESFAKYREQYKLDDGDEAILKLDDSTLISQLQGRKLKASDVLKAFIAKTLEITEGSNCVTEFIPQAQKWAEDLDNLSEVKGPLHGIPIALKDDHGVEGMDNTLGYAKWLYQPVKDSSVMVKILLSLGAVPFAKTNVPQSLMSYGCENPIWGKTLNSKNLKLSPGGSSGGSGAIVGGGGAIIATGSDIGGSLRIPAHMNGVSSLRCTLGRLSGKGVVQALPKLVGLVGVPGIIGRTAKTVSLVYKELLKDCRQNKEDPRALPIPWNDELFSSTSKLRIGYYTSLPFFPAIGDTSKTVLEAKSAMESLGHELIPFQMPDDSHYVQLVNSLLFADGGLSLRQLFLNEPIASVIQGLVGIVNTAEWKRKLLARFGNGAGSKRTVMLAKAETEARNSEDLWDKMHQKQILINDILGKMEDQKLDLILCPVFPFSACRPDDPGELLYAIVYTVIWNLVDFPAGVVPFGIESGENVNAYDDEGDAMLRIAKQAIKESTGMPIGVQFVAKPFKEEIVLRAMTELEKASEQRK